MLKSLVIAGCLLGALSLQSSAQEYNYSYGTISPDGQMNMYDQNGNYSYGTITPDGQMNLYDQNGNYSYGTVSPW